MATNTPKVTSKTVGIAQSDRRSTNLVMAYLDMPAAAAGKTPTAATNGFTG
jgi:hypothetical protein